MVECPASGQTQKDSTEGTAGPLSHVAPVTQTASIEIHVLFDILASTEKPLPWNLALEGHTYIW